MLRLFRISSRVDELEHAFEKLKQEFKFYKDEFERLEIKALESRKIYGKKLKQFVERQEKAEESDDNPFSSVILPESKL